MKAHETEGLITELERLSVLVTDPVEVDGYEKTSADYLVPTAHRVSIKEDELAPLIPMLRRIPWLTEYEGGIANDSPSGHKSIGLEAFAHWLLAQSRVRAAGSCLAALRDVLAENKSPLLEIVPIWGMAPTKSIDLGSGLNLVPIEELPPSRLKDLFTGTKRHRFSSDIANSSPRPGAAVVKETIHGPIYEPASSHSAIESRKQGELTLRAFMASSQEEREGLMREIRAANDTVKGARENPSISSEAEDMIRVVALLCPKPLFTLGQWYQRPDYLPLVGQVGGYSGPTNDHPFYIPIEKQEYPIEEIQALATAYRLLPVATRNRLKTPLARLNQGRRQLAHHTIEAAAIDLGIAAEALLTQDRDKDAPISYLLRTRGTLLLGGSPEERREHYRRLRDLYNLRSTVAHEGQIVDHAAAPRSAKTRTRLVEARETLTQAETLCGRMIQLVIARGEFPVWDDLALGL